MMNTKNTVILLLSVICAGLISFIIFDRDPGGNRDTANRNGQQQVEGSVSGNDEDQQSRSSGENQRENENESDEESNRIDELLRQFRKTEDHEELLGIASSITSIWLSQKDSDPTWDRLPEIRKVYLEKVKNISNTEVKLDLISYLSYYSGWENDYNEIFAYMRGSLEPGDEVSSLGVFHTKHKERYEMLIQRGYSSEEAVNILKKYYEYIFDRIQELKSDLSGDKAEYANTVLEGRSTVNEFLSEQQ